MSGYRRDIDGLRAAAVLPVVLYHAGATAFSGGYVGVDIFFVISGFLITGILLQDPQGFSVLEFYNRRIRRIFPALFAMLAVVTAAAVVILTPGGLKSYAAQLGATSAFSSNILFYLSSGYFATESAEKALLHTWSLAVEEQFYIVWPLLLWAMRRAPRRAILVTTLALLAASFGLSVWLTPRHPEAAFFLPVTRFWELLLGSALALHPVDFRSHRLRTAAATVGLALVAFAVVAFDHTTAFPGYAAAAPCLGAALMLAANGRGDTWVARMLSFRPVVFIGLISYSLYLWHWPLLSLGRYVAYRPLTGLEAGALVALSGLLAVLSWRFVERPFRRRSNMPGAWRASLPAGALAIGAALLIAVPIYLTQGLPQRVSPRVVLAERAKLDEPPVWNGCEPGPARPECRLGAPHGTATFLLWGDSHAAAFSPGIDEAAKTAGVAGERFMLTACPPMIGVRRLGGASRCREFNDRTLAYIARTPRIDTVVLMGRWTLAAEGTRFGAEEGGPAFLADDRGGSSYSASTRRVFAEGLDRTVAALRQARPQIRIILVGPAPEMLHDVPQCLARMTQLGRPDRDCRGVDERIADPRMAYAKSVLKDVAARRGAEVFMLDEQTCAAGRCQALIGDTVLYLDSHHLSASGARLLARTFPIAPAETPASERRP